MLTDILFGLLPPHTCQNIIGNELIITMLMFH